MYEIYYVNKTNMALKELFMKCNTEKEAEAICYFSNLNFQLTGCYYWAEKVSK